MVIKKDYGLSYKDGQDILQRVLSWGGQNLILWGDFNTVVDPSMDRSGVEAMEELLGKFQDRYPAYEKRAQIPLCDIGQRCAVKQGPRIGKLCDCSRGSSCNSFLLKCI
ncbi:cocaine- and amphetamine-regulated transcript protein-like isoform X3 [Pseudophryne corroboree]|uniref:cocaine- and amphetamine-regulated transcript protein-like isoform X3 n=1 Tax=Pseudophryne corroboree TaxID=495146 RepID=UPI003081A9A4